MAMANGDLQVYAAYDRSLIGEVPLCGTDD
jgi:hypothetical protein